MVGIFATSSMAFWIVPEKKAKLEPDILYSWMTGKERRVDLAIQDDLLVLYVGDLKQDRPYFQLTVMDDEISTYHSLHYKDRGGEVEDGVNLNSVGGKITGFIATLRTPDSTKMLVDTNDDLLFDRVIGNAKVRGTMRWEFQPQSTSATDESGAESN